MALNVFALRQGLGSMIWLTQLNLSCERKSPTQRYCAAKASHVVVPAVIVLLKINYTLKSRCMPIRYYQ